jgi:endo-1,4-beta-D-glucanase Y
MLLTYFNEDTDAYNRLWNYSRAFREYNSTSVVKMYLTPWITYSFHYKEIDNSSATDADLDIATSLVLMYYKTLNEAYKADALNIIGAIWDHEVNKTSFLLYSGDTDTWVNADPTYNLSYFSPVALRVFAMVDPAHDWGKVLDAMYTYMQQVQDAGTGVFPDWSNSAGVAVNPNNGSADKTFWTFNKESVRIPWRLAWDYYWFQDPRDLAILTKLNGFISTKASGDPSSAALGTAYSWDPAKPDIASSVVPPQWLAAWCATGLGTNADWLNACTNLVNEKRPTNSGSSYFADILLGLYTALLNGKFVRPF